MNQKPTNRLFLFVQRLGNVPTDANDRPEVEVKILRTQVA